MFKLACVLSVLTILGACGHHQPKKVSQSYQVSKSFLDAIKTKKPGKPGTDKRVPASARSLPGLSEFLLALKANPSFLKAPIGYEVVTDHSGVEQGESYKIEEKSHYLKENRNGHFVLSYYDGSESPTFTLHENQRIEDVEQEMISQEAIKSFTKVSATTFIMNFDLYEASCQMTLDLTKSSQLQGFSCKDNSGVTLNEAKIISAKLIKPQDYRSVLESIKLEVRPNALYCGMIVVDEGEEPTCFDSVRDAEEKNWSYILR